MKFEKFSRENSFFVYVFSYYFFILISCLHQRYPFRIVRLSEIFARHVIQHHVKRHMKIQLRLADVIVASKDSES